MGKREKNRSAELFDRAMKVLPGGVNSPVRAFQAVGGHPPFVARADGPHIFDVDGRRYIDLVGSWGPAIVGHAHPAVVEAVQRAAAGGLSFGACCEAEVQLAEIITQALPRMEMVRLVSSGTEATMSALRLARAATGRSKIIKFIGCYHGHVDSLLVQAGSGVATFQRLHRGDAEGAEGGGENNDNAQAGVLPSRRAGDTEERAPASAGVPAEFVAATLLAHYNDTVAVEQIFAQHGREIAAVIVEPVAGNMGYVEPVQGFLQGLRTLCDTHGALLIFDEVMTGFRVDWGGYQRLCNVKPDITCLGKVIGGGLPVGAYGGSRDLMQLLSPLGPVYQAGTLSGNPLAMAAGIATLHLCGEHGFYESLAAKAARLAEGLRQAGTIAGIAVQAGHCGGMLGLFFSEKPVRNFDDAQQADHQRFAAFFQAMMRRSVWLPPSGYEAIFVSAAHEDRVVEEITAAARDSMKEIAMGSSR